MPFIGGPLSPSGFRRRGRRRGLIGGAAIGAAAMHHFDKKNSEDQEEYASAQAQQYASPAGYAPTAETTESAELEQLAKLHAEGILTDAEFAAKKQQILGI